MVFFFGSFLNVLFFFFLLENGEILHKANWNGFINDFVEIKNGFLFLSVFLFNQFSKDFVEYGVFFFLQKYKVLYHYLFYLKTMMRIDFSIYIVICSKYQTTQFRIC